MPKRLLPLIAILAATAASAGPAAPSQFPTPAAYQASLGKGLDVDWSKTPNGAATYSARAVTAFKAAGFSHVRIRVRDAVTPALLAGLDRQVADCVKAGLIPIIAFQADAFKNDPSPANQAAAVAWWRQVAEHFRSASPTLSFDLLIEASDAINKQPETLNSYFEDAVAAIRQSNPQRIVIISPIVRSDPAHLADLRIPSRADGQMMAEWHFYASGPSRSGRKAWTTGTPAERQAVLDIIAKGKVWQDRTHIPTWVGAWMPGNYNKGNEYSVAEQATFARFVSGALVRAGIPFAVNSDSKVYDYASNRWIAEMQPVVQAILHPDASGTAPGVLTAKGQDQLDGRCINARGKVRRRCR